MNIDAEILKAQILAEENKLKQDKSTDYCDGFDDGCRLLSAYMDELTKVYQPKRNNEIPNA